MADTWKWTPHSKLCFVTTGATAPFTALIESALSASTIDTLRKHGFTHLLIQYGTAKDVYDKHSSTARDRLEQSQQEASFVIDGIDFDQDSLKSQFRLAQQSKGLVISHAGTAHLVARTRMKG